MLFNLKLGLIVVSHMLSSVISTAANFLSSLNNEAAGRRDLENLFIISDGKFPEVQTKTRTKFQLANEKLDQLIGLYRKQLRMHNLEFLNVSGVTHLIELPLDVKVPSNWMKVNSTKKTIRYHPSEVSNALDQLLLANEELSVVCRTAWDSFLKTFIGHYSEFQAAVQALAALDCLYALAMLSRDKVMENILQENFVPNDSNLHAEGQYCQIVTGPNMGGNSCYIRQVALIAIMAHVTSSWLASILARGVRGWSARAIPTPSPKCMKTCAEECCIARPFSLVIVDELGRGTSTHDGIAIAYATLHYLQEHKRCLALFVTHYPKIVEIKNEFPGSVGAYHVSYLTSQSKLDIDLISSQKMDSTDYDNVTYLYKLIPGVAERSFGFKLPASCIKRAIAMAARLEVEVCNRKKYKLLQNCSRETLPRNKAGKAEKVVSIFSDSMQADRIENLEKLENAYKDLFSRLNLALLADVGKSFHILKHAQNLRRKWSLTLVLI
ncbi:DNA mismatch repair protein MSH3 [Abeliophyllum distichum]|uniref:DNA mismatch repair protein MSH3 n=1 Tax=Abeliophyllum distichum TaxID=126358 RepID=A0ABD1P7Q0_9LAMI